MEETTSVFWVDVGYMLHNRKRVPLQDRVTDTRPVLVPVYTYYTCYLTCYTCYLITLR